MVRLRIEPQKEGKGRVFRAHLAGYVTADGLWELGLSSSTDLMRPIWLSYATSEGETRPFTMNLRIGKKALMSQNYESRRDKALEMLKSGGYSYSTQRFPEGYVTTAYLPDLFHLDPGMVDPRGAMFVLLPTKEWVASQTVDIVPVLKHLRKIGYIQEGEPVDRYERQAWPTLEAACYFARIGSLFAAYLDRRTRAPLLQDGRFHTQLLIACMKEGMASQYSDEREFGTNLPGFGLKEYHVEGSGLTRSLAFKASHDKIEQVLTQEVETFLTKA